jgi:hypothetical protein
MFLGHNISAPISQRWVSAFLIKRFRESNIGFDFQFVTKGESDLGSNRWQMEIYHLVKRREFGALTAFKHSKSGFGM